MTNDIDLLQAQANARLAKEEKEFKSTIFVSDNDMFVLPNTSTATKRSSRKPKRFTNDESIADDSETDAIWKSKRKRHPETKTVEAPRTIEYKSRPSNSLSLLQHVRVEANKLPELDVEPWCMVHCLYKCHCKGKAQKGRIFSFSNKKNEITTQGGWESITPRKRQYTFERDICSGDDLTAPKARKLIDKTEEPELIIVEEIHSTSARTNEVNRNTLKQKTAYEWKLLRNACIFAETPFHDMLLARIESANSKQAENVAIKHLNIKIKNRNKLKRRKIVKTSSISSAKPSIESIRHLDDVISDTMHRLIVMQRQNKLVLNPSPNKLSIVCWDRILDAFKARELFVWELQLADNNNALVLTDNFSKPQNPLYLKVTNINYAEIDSLPLVAKMLRKNIRNEKTKYLCKLCVDVY